MKTENESERERGRERKKIQNYHKPEIKYVTKSRLI